MKVGFVGIRHCGVNDTIESGVFRLNQVEPCRVDIVERPCVLEFRTCCDAADRSGVVCVAVERRIQVDQVNGIAIDTA